MVSLPSANRDADFLADADVFNVRRVPGPHLAFGHGIHHCLGHQLARMEMSVAAGDVEQAAEPGADGLGVRVDLPAEWSGEWPAHPADHVGVIT